MISLKKIADFAECYPKNKFMTVLTISFIAFIFFNIYLGILYENTGYPVPLLEGQTRFSPELLRSDFSFLIKNNTLEDYILIQYLDVGIMLSTAVFFTMLALYISTKLKLPHWKKLIIVFSSLFPVSSLFDLIENTFLLSMVYNPEHFPDWLAVSYSSSAVLKLLSFLIGVLSLVLIPIFSRLGIGSKIR